MPTTYTGTSAPNATVDATNIQAARSALHAAAGGKLVALVLTEYLQYPNGSDLGWNVTGGCCGAESANAGVSTRSMLIGDPGCMAQQVVVGIVPAGRFKLISTT